MRPIARRSLAAATILLTAALLSGCIVCIEDPCGHDTARRRASLYIYARDYYSGAPIPWAYADLYERDWWDWDYVGTWEVNSYGHVVVRDGYLYRDGSGGRESEDYLVVVGAYGYYTEDYSIELSYYYPSETLTFYLMPAYGRAAGAGQSDEGERFRAERTPAPVLSGPPDDGHPAGKIVVGDAADEGGVPGATSTEEPGSVQGDGDD
jgi:hypothetical protein